MNKLVRAGLEAVITIVVTLAIIVGAFSTMFGIDELIALSGIYYVVWMAIILITHLALAKRRRHIRLGLGVATGVAVMLVHLAMFLTGNVAVEINIVPVILHDFGFALISMIVLNIVHLVIFRRRQTVQPPAPLTSERVDDIPAPGTPPAPELPQEPTAAEYYEQLDQPQAKSA